MITEESMPAIDHRSLVLGTEGKAVLRAEAARLSRYLGSGLDADDLLQAGRIGLMLAAERYEPARGRFGTYARWWVLAEMAKVIQHSRSPMRLPASVRCQLRRCESMAREQGVLPDTAVLMEELGISARQARTLGTLICGVGAMEADTEALPDPRAADEAVLLESIEQARLKVVLRQEAARLSAREQVVITGLYGLDGAPRRTLQEVGKQLGLSHQRVQQLRRQVLGRLRRQMLRASARPVAESLR